MTKGTFVIVVAVLTGCSGDDGDRKPPRDDAPSHDTATTTDPDPPTGALLADLAYSVDPDHSTLPVLRWRQGAAATVRIELKVDDDWVVADERPREAGPQSRVVAGIPYDHVASWRLVADGLTLDGPPIHTGPVPADLPSPTLVAADPSRWDPADAWFVGSINQEWGGWTGGTYWAFILDRKGRYVWAQPTPNRHWTLFVTPALSGDHLVWDEATKWSDFGDGDGGKLHRAYLDREIEVIDAPGLHHAWVELPDGSFVWGSQAHGGGEALVQKSPGQQGETVLWSCREDWPGSLDWRDHCESNSLFWIPGTDTFLYSFYTNNSVVEVGPSGESVWWAGDVVGGRAFVPAEAQYRWQHGISYTPQGTLLVTSEWDGGDGGAVHTWLLEYEVDPGDGTLSLIWSSDSGTRATTNGAAWRLPNGNTLHVVGSASVIREVDTALDVDVWRVEFPENHLLGQGWFIADPNRLLAP